ncbi:hypothetical protein EFR00_17530 [Rhizobium sophoriradicis]|uniref:hypothetical protein n=1 Tax=Rhizobium sophoriradicis TaxID=1535245 RepID=UPI00098FAE02|nr:hypothetical protein [Rhizobium sophoriradicis]RSC01897.1 hypothetical protein EFR00_17530 [Rhizobium sophoriradicis]
MSTERREHEARPSGGGRKGLRSIKMPGEQRHVERSESATDIARRLAATKREKQMKERLRG